MFKRLLSAVIVSVLLVTCSVNTYSLAAIPENSESKVTVTANSAEKSDLFNFKSKAAILFDATTGSVLYEKNSHEKLPIASITKIMTMLLVMEAIDDGRLKFEDMVQTSEHAYSMGGSQVYLKPGEEFTVLEMMKAVAIHSANDAAVALAEKLSGSEDTFVKEMNDKAKQLGMNDTNFLDCSGLTDENHYSSAYDVAVMSAELINKHPKVLEFTSTWHDTFRNGLFSLDNTNKLLRSYEGMNGLKTGSTSKAGNCLSASAKRNNMQLVSVILGAVDTNTRFAETKTLLDYGFAHYEMTVINKKGEEIGTAVVKKGLQKNVTAIFKGDVNLLIGKGETDKITREVKLDTNIIAPVTEGQKIGVVEYKVGDKLLGTADVIAKNNVTKASFIRLFFRMVTGWFGIGK